MQASYRALKIVEVGTEEDIEWTFLIIYLLENREADILALPVPNVSNSLVGERIYLLFIGYSYVT
jgi:hypothetical protein